VCVCVCERIECLENQRTNLKLVRNVERPAGAVAHGHVRRAETFLRVCYSEPIHLSTVKSNPGCGLHLPSTPAAVYSVVGAFEKGQRTEDAVELVRSIYNSVGTHIYIYIVYGEVSRGDIARTSIKITNIYRNPCRD